MDVVVARRRSGVGNGTVVAACELGLIPLPRDIHEPGHGVETTVGPAQVAGQPIARRLRYRHRSWPTTWPPGRHRPPPCRRRAPPSGRRLPCRSARSRPVRTVPATVECRPSEPVRCRRWNRRRPPPRGPAWRRSPLRRSTERRQSTIVDASSRAGMPTMTCRMDVVRRSVTGIAPRGRTDPRCGGRAVGGVHLPTVRGPRRRGGRARGRVCGSGRRHSGRWGPSDRAGPGEGPVELWIVEVVEQPRRARRGRRIRPASPRARGRCRPRRPRRGAAPAGARPRLGGSGPRRRDARPAARAGR